MLNKTLASMINKTPSAISYVKKTNLEEYELLRLGAFCKEAGWGEDVLKAMIDFKKNVLDKSGNGLEEEKDA
jgi:hypothetical protein